MNQSQLRRFLNFVEIRTKLATFLPFCAALAYVFYTNGSINVRSTLIYLLAALFLDMSVTAINNYFNSKEENEIPHYGQQISLVIIGIMMLIAIGLGLYLVYLHGFTILFLGVYCFFIGIAYSFGPAPICKSPYGEIFSGFTIGTVIMFIVVSINDPAFLPLGLSFSLSELRLGLDIDLVYLFTFGVVTLPATLAGANIMLANNICDREADRLFRYTLVHSLGLKKSLFLFAGLYYFAYFSILLAILLGRIPLFCILTLGTFPIVQKNVRRFKQTQSKQETFVLSVKNFTLILVVYALSMAFGAIIPMF